MLHSEAPSQQQFDARCAFRRHVARRSSETPIDAEMPWKSCCKTGRIKMPTRSDHRVGLSQRMGEPTIIRQRYSNVDGERTQTAAYPSILEPSLDGVYSAMAKKKLPCIAPSPEGKNAHKLLQKHHLNNRCRVSTAARQENWRPIQEFARTVRDARGCDRIADRSSASSFAAVRRRTQLV